LNLCVEQRPRPLSLIGSAAHRARISKVLAIGCSVHFVLGHEIRRIAPQPV
jgi:hypothetical protein